MTKCGLPTISVKTCLVHTGDLTENTKYSERPGWLGVWMHELGL